MRQEGGERLSPMTLTTTIIGGMNLHNAAMSKPVTPNLKVFGRLSKCRQLEVDPHPLGNPTTMVGNEHGRQ